MPCYATGSAEGDAQLAVSEAYAEVTRLTRILCATCEWLEGLQRADPKKYCTLWPLPLAKWWGKHKKIDAKRKEDERRQLEKLQARERAIKKLTPTERAALGL